MARYSLKTKLVLALGVILFLAGLLREPSHFGLTAEAAGPCRVLQVVDGDTVTIACAGREAFRARLLGFDAPESYQPGCDAERWRAEAARDRLAALLSHASELEVKIGPRDRYGRVLTELHLDGRDVGEVMIAEGLAVPYRGGRRIDWCSLPG